MIGVQSKTCPSITEVAVHMADDRDIQKRVGQFQILLGHPTSAAPPVAIAIIIVIIMTSVAVWSFLIAFFIC